jgi:hypothetical protein
MTAAPEGFAYRYYVRSPDTRTWDEVTEWDYAAMLQALRELPSFFDGVQIARSRVAAAEAAAGGANGPTPKG